MMQQSQTSAFLNLNVLNVFFFFLSDSENLKNAKYWIILFGQAKYWLTQSIYYTYM